MCELISNQYISLMFCVQIVYKLTRNPLNCFFFWQDKMTSYVCKNLIHSKNGNTYFKYFSMV